MRLLPALAWGGVAALGAAVLAAVALQRGEAVNAVWLVIAAVCIYAAGQRLYATCIAQRIFHLDDRRRTPAVRLEDGHDYVPTPKWVVFGHHFAAIAGAGPLVGPILAAQFGWLPGTLWIVIGVVLGGAVQDLVILCASLRRDGKSVAQMAREEVGGIAGGIALFSIVGILLILIAFLGLVVVNAMAESPWSVVTVGATIPIALLMGLWMRVIRPGRVLEATAIGLALLAGALWLGGWVAHRPDLAGYFHLSTATLGWSVLGYGFVAAVLPVWLLLAPRDYLSAFVKVGTVVLLAVGILWVAPELRIPALNPAYAAGGMWADGSGPVVKGGVFPFCFIVIACGAISGFHSLVASGTTPKMIARESDAPAIAYGGMLMESLVALLAMIAAASLDPGLYYAMNVGALKAVAAKDGLEPVAVQVNQWISGWAPAVTPADLQRCAEQVGESSIVGRAGGAPTLAVGMAHIFSRIVAGDGAMAFWYHFAIMFEALFILTTVDAGTRVGRFLMQEVLGRVWTPLGRTTSWPANILASALIVAGWGWFLMSAVYDPSPTGGVRGLVPLFGVSNQLLAAVALAVATVIIVRMGRARWAWVTLLPLAWLVVVTETAGWNLLFGSEAVRLVKSQGATTTQVINAVLCGIFMTVILVMLVLAAWRCWRLLSGRDPIVTHGPPTRPEPGPSEAELREG